ncbi:MAG: tetratricopeptide repeat protein [Bacteroidota bacterium]
MARKTENKGKHSPAAKASLRQKQTPFLMPAICILMGFIAYIPVFTARFVNWDDNDYVTKNSVIQSPGNFKAIITLPVQGNYHPLTMVTLAINYAVSGMDATSYHVVNLLLHLLNVLLVFFFIYRLTGRKAWIAFVTALLFAVHPLHVESVAWVTERKDVLYSFFFLSGLVIYLRYLEKKRLIQLAAVLGLFVLSLLSKPAAIIFPVVLLTVDFYYKRLGETRTYVEKVPFILLSVIFGVLTVMGQSSTGAVQYSMMIPALFKVFFGFYGIMMYLVKALVPVNLCAFYPYPAVNEALPFTYYLSPLVTLLLAILFFVLRRKNRIISFAILFYLANLALVLQFYPVGSAILADRYSYIPLTGLFLAAGYYFQEWAGHNSGKPGRPAMVLLIALTSVLTVLSYRQAYTWKNSELLWDQAISAAPSSKAFTNRGFLYKEAGLANRAFEMYTQAIILNKAEKDALMNRGDILFAEKKYKEAIDDYNMCLSVYPDVQQAIQNRGAAYTALGNYDRAMADMNRALSLNPNSVNGYANRALLEQQLNRHQAAIDDLYHHMQITPDTTGDIWNAIGVSYLRLGENDNALGCFDKAIGISQNQAFLNNRALVLARRSKLVAK